MTLTRFWLPCARASGDDSGTSAGRTDANSCLSGPGARSAHEICRMVQSSFRAYVKSTRSIDEIDRHGMCFRIDLAAQPDRDQNGDLRARVVAVDVGRRIRLGISERLRLFQRVGKRKPRAVHAREDVVAGAVQDAGHAQQPIAGEPFSHGANDRNAAGHRRLEQQLALLLDAPAPAARRRASR